MTEGNGKVKELPKGWIEVNLKNLVFPNRPRVSPQKYPNFPFIGMEHISPQTMKLLGTDTAKNMRSNAVHFYSDDVLYGRLRPYLNKVYKPDFEGLCSSEFIVFPETECLISKYLQYLLNSAKFVSFASHLNEGERPRVDFNAIGDYKFLLPPLNEQNRIVEKIEELFSDLDQGIESLKTAQKQLKVYRQVVLKWAFEGKLTEKWRSQIQQEKLDIQTGEELLAQIKAERENRYQQQLAEWEEAVREWEAIGKSGKKPTKPQKTKDILSLPKAKLSELPKLPSSWCWVRLQEISRDITDGDHQPPPKAQEGIPFIVISNIQNHKVDFSNTKFVPRSYYQDIQQNRKPKKDDILYTVTGSFGIPCLIDFDKQFCFQRHIGLIRMERLVSKKYTFYLLQSAFIYQQATKISTGTAQKTVPLSGLREFRIPLPSNYEQEQIVQEIGSRLSICAQIEYTIVETLQKAEALRQSILKQAFEGKLVPQDPNDEPAEKLLERIKQEKIKVKKDEQLSIQGL